MGISAQSRTIWRAMSLGRLEDPSGERYANHLYRLKFQPEDGRPAKEIEFVADDSHQALIIAQKEARTGSAELWRDGRMLCSIRRSEPELWEILPAR